MSAISESKVSFRPKRIDSIQSVIEFDLDADIILKLGTGLLNLSRSLKAERIVPSIPEDAPPDAPRTVLKAKDTTVIASLVRITVATKPPSHIQGDIGGALEFHKARAHQAFELLSQEVSYDWSGVIIDIEYPARTTDENVLEICTPFFDSLLNVERRDRDLASFQLAIGFTERGFHRNFNISGYETREFLVKPEPGQKWTKLDTSKHPPSEVGMKIRTDINNKPRNEHVDLITEIQELWEEHKSTFNNLDRELGLEELFE